MVIAGVMSGSSLDGLDVALVDIKVTDGELTWKIIDSFGVEYTPAWVDRLRNYHLLTASEYVRLKYDYSYLIGQTLTVEIKNRNAHVDYISFHGHTLLHHPELGFTEQIGNGGIIAGLTSINTITDFRNQDIAVGGVGTPLAPIVEKELFAGYDYYLNLGGIANITAINSESILAYDICPCNQVLNYFSLRLGHEYDDGGDLARSGSFKDSIQNYLSSISYFDNPAPKSLDNNWIRTEFIKGLPTESDVDTLHTFTNWMAKCIANQIADTSRMTKMLVTGGGTHNTYFIELLLEELKKQNCSLVMPDKDIIDNKEAVLMSLLGYKYLHGETNVLCSVTGASRDSIGGAMYKV